MFVRFKMEVAIKKHEKRVAHFTLKQVDGITLQMRSDGYIATHKIVCNAEILQTGQKQSTVIFADILIREKRQ